jgi:hypothetical protein
MGKGNTIVLGEMKRGKEMMKHKMKWKIVRCRYKIEK